ncbi:MAG: tRNA (adenosine(37)-N6)-dimethylallyltransferase MiaA [Candidatus Neomarinimicrobiota bacterium]|jgi:tRNA dimethylallyltransferase|nr:tRNA (adenosine(37)-N6)-dimethylallyltransferase MiaA [Candidatus Neomarinimicrobiota bacterium]|tara:strand:- start:100 stop:1053 length:954 start_codon:yes stop_codon:yes gene_type:complete
MISKNYSLAIIGPTASGKSEVAVALAKKINGEVVGMDSRQIYEGMAIGTAQPTLDEQGGVPHHMIGIKPLNEEIAAGAYAKLVLNLVTDIQSRGKIPVICGGAGLYYRAITKGIFEESVSDLNARKQLEDEYDKNGSTNLMDRLMELDPEYAEIVHPNNKKRLIRALEIYASTGKPPTEHYQNQSKDSQPQLDLFTIYMDWELDELGDRIAKRTTKMLKAGWVNEVRTLMKQYPDEVLHPLDSIGYSQIITYLNDEISEEELETEITLRTRQFAVRQIKWFRKETIDLTIKMSVERSLKVITEEIIQNLKFNSQKLR